jgi:hypothetical protein
MRRSPAAALFTPARKYLNRVGHLVAVVDMAELINLGGAELGNARKKPES